MGDLHSGAWQEWAGGCLRTIAQAPCLWSSGFCPMVELGMVVVDIFMEQQSSFEWILQAWTRDPN